MRRVRSQTFAYHRAGRLLSKGEVTRPRRAKSVSFVNGLTGSYTCKTGPLQKRTFWRGPVLQAARWRSSVPPPLVGRAEPLLAEGEQQRPILLAPSGLETLR